jgi:hypothetical protein
MSELSSYVCISFALRGAPCGDYSGPSAASFRRYHNQQATQVGPTDGHGSGLIFGVNFIEHLKAVRVEEHRLGFRERDAVLPRIPSRLSSVPVVQPHGCDDRSGLLPATYSGIGARTTRSLSLT